MIDDAKVPGLRDLPYYMQVAHDIECGLIHSGLPSCCVAYFVTEYTVLDEKSRKVHQLANRKGINGKRGPGYVRCPRCIKEKVVVTVKPCACVDVFERGKRFQHSIHTGRLKPIPGTNGFVDTTANVTVHP
jgi:hypothetical protein